MNEVDLTIAGRKTDGPSSARLVATLALAGFVSGLAIAGAYRVTQPTIEANQARARRAAVLRVVPGATSMQMLTLDEDGSLRRVDDAAEPGREVIFAAYGPDGAFLGYAIEGEGPGYQDTIRVLFGYAPESQRVIGMYVLESRETPGLGDRIYKDEAFVANFDDLAIDAGLVLVSDGRDAANEVDAISGATISSRAVVRIIDEAHLRWRPLLPAPGEEPPRPDDGPDGGGE